MDDGLAGSALPNALSRVHQCRVLVVDSVCVCATTGYLKTLALGDSFQGIVLSPASDKCVSIEDKVWERLCCEGGTAEERRVRSCTCVTSSEGTTVLAVWCCVVGCLRRARRVTTGADRNQGHQRN